MLNESQESRELLGSIRRGVAVILWAVLTHTFVWPIGWALSTWRDEPLLSFEVMIWAIPISAVLAYIASRMVFPIQYPESIKSETKSGE